MLVFSRRCATVLAVLGATAASGCLSEPGGTSGLPSGSGAPGIDGGFPDVGPAVTDIDGGLPVGPTGSVLTGDGATLIVPPGALRTARNMLVQLAGVDAPPLPAGRRALSPVFEALPHGLTFAKPATLALPTGPGGAGLSRANAVLLTAGPHAGWTEVPGAEFGATQVRAELVHLSFFVVATAVPPDGGPAGGPDAGDDAAFDGQPDAAVDASAGQ